MRTLLFLLLFAVLLSCKEEKKIDGLPSQLDSLFATVPDFSGVVLVAEKGKPVYHRPFGHVSLEADTHVDTATIFELASVSKTFTAMIIMMLMEEGKLTYDDQLEKYVPGLPYPGITIRQLLTHTSGLPDYQELMDQYWDKSKAAGNADIIEYLKQYHPPALASPGEKFIYSNSGYVMLGSIAEAATGKDFITLCRERIFQPLHMSFTDIRTNEEKRNTPNFAKGYIYSEEENNFLPAEMFAASNYIVWLGNRKGPGRVSSTASDLLKWDRGLYPGVLVKKETLDECFAPVRLKNDSTLASGFSWSTRINPVLGKVVQHSGDNPGYRTTLIRYIETDKTVIVLSNNAHPQFSQIVDGIVKLLAAGKVL